MTSKSGVTALLDKYDALTVADQTVLQALSALYEPAAATVVSSCLNGAGCRESPMRAFGPQNVAIRLGRLAKTGFCGEQSEELRGQKIRLWRCRPEFGEIAIRHAVRDGLFLPLAKAALSETRGRDWKGEGASDNPRRRFRLAFHAGDWRLGRTELSAIGTERPGEGGAFLASLVRLQPDDSWRRTAKPAFFAPVLAAALRDLIAGTATPGPLEELARDVIEKDQGNPARNELILALAELLVLRGKMRDAVKTAHFAEDETRSAALLFSALAEGGMDAAQLAENILARRRSRLGAREALPVDSVAVWVSLGIMAGDVPEAMETMLRLLSAPPVQEHPFSGALSCLRHAFLFMTGQASAARAIPDRPPDGHPMTVLCHALSLQRIDPQRVEPLHPQLTAAANTATAAGYRWLGSQFDAFATMTDAANGNEAEQRWPPLIRFFQGDDAWRRGLRALEDLAAEDMAEAASSRKRLAWLVTFPERPETPYVPFEIQPVEQTLGKDGLWSKGRNLALRRIFQKANELPYVTDQDRLVFSTLRYDFDGVSHGFRFDSGTALTHLIGHPQVYRGDAGGAKMEVVAGQFELSVTATDGGCEISMEPTLADFLPDHAAEPHDESHSRDIPPTTAARLETPTRLRVYPLGARERRLARVVGDGLRVPVRGRDEAIRTLGRLSGKIRLHSDIPELAGEGELIEADSRPRFHIIPQHPGLKVEVWAHPLGDDGPAYRPGRGGRMLTATMEGQTVRTRRNTNNEKELAAAVIDACPSLAGHVDGDLSWRLDDPEDALAFLAETENLADRAVLVWPKGGRFRVRRLQGLGGMSLRVNSKSEWFEVDGTLHVDENLVLDMRTLLTALRASTAASCK